MYIGELSPEFIDEMDDINMCTNDIRKYNSIYDASEFQTIRAYWENNHHRLWYEMGKRGQSPQFLSPELMKDILTRKFQSPSMFVICNFQDFIALKEVYIKNRNPHLETWVSENKLQFRFTVTTDQLNSDIDLQTIIHTMINTNSRIMN